MLQLDVVQVGFFKYLLDSLDLSSQSQNKLLKQSKLFHFNLDHEEGYVPLYGMYQLLELLSYEVGVEDFIRYFDRSIQIQNMSAYGDFYLSAPDLLSLAKLAENQSQYIISSETDSLKIDGDRAVFAMKLSSYNHPGAELTARTLLAITIKHIRLACGNNWNPISIHWPFKTFHDYDELFTNVEVILNMKHLEIVFNTDILNKRIDIASKANTHKTPITSNSQKIECLLNTLTEGYIPTLTQMADLNNVSERTFQRRLFEEGATYNGIIDDWRFKESLKLIAQEKSIAEISEQLGFLTKQNFHRSFRRWTGTTPAAYKAKDKL